MVNFEYFTPTKVVFGKGTQSQTGALLQAQGVKKVLIHYGSERVRQSGLLDEIYGSLAAAGIPYVELGGVVPNPRLALVYDGIALAIENGVDFILAVGGGSVIDSAKAIAYGVPYSGDVWDIFEGKAKPQAALPVGAVLTIAAAGSEMSASCVISNEEEGKKRGVNSEWGRCRFAIMNPELTLSVPAFETACGNADIMMHTMERYFTAESTMEVTDGIAESLLRTVIRNAQTLTREGQNYAARAEVMWAGALSHNGLTGCGGSGDWAPHQLAHEVGARFDTAHGAALTALWGSWARYVYEQNPARFARFALEVLELPEEGSVEDIALAGIEELESFFWGLELPVSFADLDIHLSDDDLHDMAVACSWGGARTIGGFKELGVEDMEAIYRMANETPES